MRKASKQWSKEELKFYILLLCAKADGMESLEEIDLIKSKTSTEIFDLINAELTLNSVEESIEKIENTIARLNYSDMELAEFKKDIHSVFIANKYFSSKEINFNRILKNVIY